MDLYSIMLIFRLFILNIITEHGGSIGVSGSNPGKTTKLLGTEFNILTNHSIKIFDDIF